MAKQFSKVPIFFFTYDSFFSCLQLQFYCSASGRCSPARFGENALFQCLISHLFSQYQIVCLVLVYTLNDTSTHKSFMYDVDIYMHTKSSADSMRQWNNQFFYNRFFILTAKFDI